MGEPTGISPTGPGLTRAPEPAPARSAAPITPLPAKVTSGNLASCKPEAINDPNELPGQRAGGIAACITRHNAKYFGHTKLWGLSDAYAKEKPDVRWAIRQDPEYRKIIDGEARNCFFSERPSADYMSHILANVRSVLESRFMDSDLKQDFLNSVLETAKRLGIVFPDAEIRSFNSIVYGGQVAEKYWTKLHDVFRAKSIKPDDQIYLAAKNAVISTFGVDPADPSFDLKKFHPDHASVAAVSKTIYLTYRLPGSDREQNEKNLNCLASPLDGVRLELMANDLNNFVEAYRAAPNADARTRKSLRESPEGQRALRNAAIWAATPGVWDDNPQRWLETQEDSCEIVVKAYLLSDADLTVDFLRYFNDVRRR